MRLTAHTSNLNSAHMILPGCAVCLSERPGGSPDQPSWSSASSLHTAARPGPPTQQAMSESVSTSAATPSHHALGSPSVAGGCTRFCALVLCEQARQMRLLCNSGPTESWNSPTEGRQWWPCHPAHRTGGGQCQVGVRRSPGAPQRSQLMPLQYTPRKVSQQVRRMPGPCPAWICASRCPIASCPPAEKHHAQPRFRAWQISGPSCLGASTCCGPAWRQGSIV